MCEIDLEDLKELYLASLCRCDECIVTFGCIGCKLSMAQQKAKEILESNGLDVSVC